MSRAPRAEATGERAAGRQRRLARILDAAEELFATHGFAKTTVDEIAAAAGVSKGLVYDHYVSKEALLGAIWDQLVEDWTRAVSEGKFDEGAIADSIGAMVHGSLEYVRTNPLLRRIIALDPGALIPGGRESQIEFGRRYRAALEPVLAHGVRRGQLRRDLDVAHTAEVHLAPALHAHARAVRRSAPACRGPIRKSSCAAPSTSSSPGCAHPEGRRR